MLRIAAIVFALTSPTPEASKKLVLPGYISPVLRTLLAKQMEHHGEAAQRLTMGVVLLSYDDVAEVALDMSERPGLARPRQGEQATINVALPKVFFVFQDQLRARAKDLALGAKERNNAKLNKAFQRVTETCMACHAAYLNGPGSTEDWWPVGTAHANDK